MTTFLKFLLGNNKCGIRKNAFKNSFVKKNNGRRKFVYNSSHSFSVRTDRDKFQSCGELYVDDASVSEGLINQDECIPLICENDTNIEGLVMQDNFESEHCSIVNIAKTEGLRFEDDSDTLNCLEKNYDLLEGVCLVMDDGSDYLSLERKIRGVTWR